MTDKLYFISGDMFPLTNPLQKFVVYDETKQTWVLNEERWFNYCGPDMANRGVNMFRWLGWNAWNADHNLAPWVRNDDGNFDLSKRNDIYWELAEKMIRTMNYPSQTSGKTAPGITLWIDLFYQYPDASWGGLNSPWWHNTQGINGLYDLAARPYAESYMMEWFKLSKEKGLKIVYGMGNEMGEDSLDFCYWMLEVMNRELIWPFSWAIGPDIPSDGNDLFKMLPKYIYDHNLFMWYPLRSGDRWDTSIIRPTHGCCNCVNPQGTNVFLQAMEYWACLPIRWQVSDDGCMGGTTPRPGVAEWQDMVTKICTWRGTDALTIPWSGIDYPPTMAIEHLPDDEPWDDCRDQQLLIFDAMAAPYTQYVGQWENKGQWPDAYVPCECKAGETKTETCSDGSTIITHTCENGKWKETGNVCPENPQKCSCWYYLNIHDTMLGIPNFLKCIFGKKEPYCKDK